MNDSNIENVRFKIRKIIRTLPNKEDIQVRYSKFNEDLEAQIQNIQEDMQEYILISSNISWLTGLNSGLMAFKGHVDNNTYYLKAIVRYKQLYERQKTTNTIAITAFIVLIISFWVFS